MACVDEDAVDQSPQQEINSEAATLEHLVQLSENAEAQLSAQQASIEEMDTAHNKLREEYKDLCEEFEKAKAETHTLQLEADRWRCYAEQETRRLREELKEMAKCRELKEGAETSQNASASAENYNELDQQAGKQNPSHQEKNLQTALAENNCLEATLNKALEEIHRLRVEAVANSKREPVLSEAAPPMSEKAGAHPGPQVDTDVATVVSFQAESFVGFPVQACEQGSAVYSGWIVKKPVSSTWGRQQRRFLVLHPFSILWFKTDAKTKGAAGGLEVTPETTLKVSSKTILLWSKGRALEFRPEAFIETQRGERKLVSQNAALMRWVSAIGDQLNALKKSRPQESAPST